jgi:hypothetical protein
MLSHLIDGSPEVVIDEAFATSYRHRCRFCLFACFYPDKEQRHDVILPEFISLPVFPGKPDDGEIPFIARGRTGVDDIVQAISVDIILIEATWIGIGVLVE